MWPEIHWFQVCTKILREINFDEFRLQESDILAILTDTSGESESIEEIGPWAF